MEIASRTPEGESGSCIVCGHSFYIDPATPCGDAPCPNCGTLLWFETPTDHVHAQLADRGVFVTTDENGQVVALRFCGDTFTDRAISRIAQITGVHTIDIRDTRISPVGAQRLRQIFPDALILYHE